MSDDDEVQALREQIRYLQQALTAISSQGVDAVVIGEPDGEQIYTLTSADRPYRVLVESMGEGAVTVSESGVVLFANPQLASFLGVDREAMVGHDLAVFVDDDQRAALDMLLAGRGDGTRRAELTLRDAGGTAIPFQVAATDLDVDDVLVRCLVLTDLRLHKQMEQALAARAARDAADGERRRVVREVNDTIVQGLVTAEMAMDLDQIAYARTVIGQTSSRARQWIGELLEGQPLEPGMALRREPAGSKRGAG